MLRNYFIVAWRNLTKHRLNAGINVLGLAVAFTCSILLFLMVHREFSFDGFQKFESSLFELYVLSRTPGGDGKSTSMAYPVVSALKSEAPAISKATGFMSAGSGIRYKNKELDKDVTLVNNDFFSMFSFPVLSGQKANPLAGTGEVVISKSTADAVFGKEDPVGKFVKVKVNGAWNDLLVSAVLRDAPENSSIRYDILARMEISGDYAQNKNAWNVANHMVFVETAPGITLAKAETELREIVKKYHLGDDENLKNANFLQDSKGDPYAWKLAPFASLHFDRDLGFFSDINKTYLYTLILIALVVLAIACFNFINLNTARAFTRAKEVGIRKTIGAGKKQIFFQLWTESFLLCTLALGIGMVIASTVLGPFNDLFEERLSISELLNPVVMATVLGGMLLVSFLAGGYPAWLVCRFNPVTVLKGKVSMKGSAFVRNGLITFQFILSSLLICSTIVIYKQFQYLRAAPLGIKQESVISIPVKNADKTHIYIDQLRTRLYGQPQIISVTGSSTNIGLGVDYDISKSDFGFRYDGKNIHTNMLAVDYDFFATLGIRPLDGRDFDRNFPSDTSSTMTNVVITESLYKELGKKDAIGFSFYPDSSAPKWNIIGIVPDIHLYSMYEKGTPLAFLMSKNYYLGYILVKVNSDNPVQAMSLIKATYKDIEPDNTLSPSYLTENTRRWYEKEQRLSSIFTSAASVAIILSCLGLFAIVSLVLQQRRKEIGVRKVLGASMAAVTALLSGDFLKLIALSFLIAVPIAWYFLNQWLENYIYRTPINWWIFPVAGLLSITIALLTISFQTVKASLANPVESLRAE
jgi:putative ABC transport system permease protein